jgi:hypothetical protein
VKDNITHAQDKRDSIHNYQKQSPAFREAGMGE